MEENNALKIKDVMVRIKSEQSEYGEKPTRIEQISEGQLFKSGNEWNLTYKEARESGLDESFTTIHMHEDGTVSLDRIGVNQMKMEFVKGKKHIARMDTPHGVLDIGILTNQVKINMNENGGKIALSYIINLNDEYPVQTKMTMQVTAK
jgi:uncharacterized beta-barrel protein YwiB (DUF1934 family)